MRKLLAYIYIFFRNILGIKKIFSFGKKEINLPQDDGFLSHEDIQWWYWTGHLRGENEEKFGFELVFFTFDSWIFFKNILAQSAISDINNNIYKFQEKVDFLKLPKKLDSAFELISKDLKGNKIISALGGNGKDELYFKLENYEIKLNLVEKDKPVIHYDGKRHKYCFGGDTLYYAREAMETIGTIIKDGKEIKVKGESWFDRQYGELYQAIFKGWQWFAIELNDGKSIMLYDFRQKEYNKERFGSITKNNVTETITFDDYSVEILKTWTSPETKITYPSSWKVKIKNEVYFISPSIDNQELRAKHHIWIGPEYWEGACIVKDILGNEIGRAYVELNGYGKYKIITID